MTMPDRFAAGAVDLGQVKARAEAKEKSASQPAGSIPSSITVTAENLEAEVLRRSLQVPVIVLIGTGRSPESEQLRTDLSELAEASRRGFIFAYVDADATPQVAQAFGVRGLPTVLVLAGGRPLTSLEGGQPRQVLEQWTQQIVSQVGSQLEGLPPEEGSEEAEEARDPRFDEAESAAGSEDYARALSLYVDILEDDPENRDARQARHQIEILQRMSESEGEDPIAAADAHPEDFDAARAAADAEIANGDPEAAFRRLIAFLRGPERDAARARLLELFELFDAGDPRVLAARGQMASALF
ncbi:tetratricopeptide repeat protein [Corynebacterium uropygiale]|uniref:Tetratricopeptide repeat protein n=1 Tax=Corynebacterium uropygiale TaxID=1775911 RepID=A0A9X1QPH4_9CORY|nr:tetratricopeptide repeat protein [Corynebacterium uropygiale]MCF4006969.1 tetratricopeptide repeat protein [Corynebacterium uropygiale]